MLRDEILDAATELLLATGQAREVSIRAVAMRVGVTPPSIYLHFSDKDALLDAVCARYFEQLDQQMQQAARDQPTTLDALRAQGLAYVRFAAQTPELYRIATMSPGPPANDVDAALTTAAFVHMRDSVVKLMGEGIYPPGDPTAVALELWSVTHGVAALLIAKPHLPFGDPEAFADRILKAVSVGQIVTGLLGPDATQKETLAWLSAERGNDA